MSGTLSGSIDILAQQRVSLREAQLHRLALHRPEQEGLAHVGEGVSEMREFFGPGWRMYYTERNGMLIIMLGGGDKSTQSDDIARAIAMSRHITE